MRQIAEKALIGFVGFVLGMGFLVTLVLHVPVPPWRDVYAYLELIGAAGIVASVALLWLTASQRRPFTSVPQEGRWWEFLVLGATGAVVMVLALLSVITTVIILPIVMPFKVYETYILDRTASWVSFLLAFPVIFLLISTAFAMAHLVLMRLQRGQLMRDQQSLYTGGAGEPWPILETFSFSLSAMVTGALQYEATGWCRGLAIAEIVVGRLLVGAIITLVTAVILRVLNRLT